MKVKLYDITGKEFTFEANSVHELLDKLYETKTSVEPNYLLGLVHQLDRHLVAEHKRNVELIQLRLKAISIHTTQSQAELV